MKTISQLLFVSLTLFIITTSCSIEKRRYRSGYYTQWNGSNPNHVKQDSVAIKKTNKSEAPPAAKEGDNILSVGYGFGVIDGWNTCQSNGITTTAYSGPFYFKYEHAFTHNDNLLTMGINAAYGQYQISNNPYQDIYSTFSILAKLNWHLEDAGRFDPYWGIGVGYRSVSSRYSANNPGGDNFNYDNTNFTNVFSFPVGLDPNTFLFHLGFEMTLGIRYYLTDDLAIYMEAGLAKSVAQAGLSFKVK